MPQIRQCIQCLLPSFSLRMATVPLQPECLRPRFKPCTLVRTARTGPRSRPHQLGTVACTKERKASASMDSMDTGGGRSFHKLRLLKSTSHSLPAAWRVTNSCRKNAKFGHVQQLCRQPSPFNGLVNHQCFSAFPPVVPLNRCSWSSFRALQTIHGAGVVSSELLIGGSLQVCGCWQSCQC